MLLPCRDKAGGSAGAEVLAVAKERDWAHLGVLDQLSCTFLLSRCSLQSLPRQRREKMQPKKYPQKWLGPAYAFSGRFTAYSQGASLSEVGCGEVHHGVVITGRD